jgi:hypothetical protein
MTRVYLGSECAGFGYPRKEKPHHFEIEEDTVHKTVKGAAEIKDHKHKSERNPKKPKAGNIFSLSVIKQNTSQNEEIEYPL